MTEAERAHIRAVDSTLARLRAQTAAHTRWAKTADRLAATAPARQAALDRFEREVDPDGVLAPTERAKRAANARKAHMSRMALASAKVRRERGRSRGGSR
jgi:hypothetical protein